MTHDQDILDYLLDRQQPADRETFERRMAQDATLAAEVEVMRAVRTELASGPEHTKADVVWDRISATLDAEPRAANDNRSPWQSILKYAAVAVLAVSAWQIAVVPRIATVPEGFRTASEPSDIFSFQVKFFESATLAEITALLAPFEGQIIDGPSALGLIRLSFPDERIGEAARVAFSGNSTVVEFVAD